MVSKTIGIFSNQIQKFEFDMLDKEITQEKPWCLSVTINPAFTICVYMPNEDFQVKISIKTFCYVPKIPVFLQFKEKFQIVKFLPKKFCCDFQQILMSLVKIGQNK